MTDHLLKAPDVAERLNISKALAYRLMNETVIPSIRFGRSVRVRPEDLEEFIASRVAGSAHVQLTTEPAIEAEPVVIGRASPQKKESRHGK